MVSNKSKEHKCVPFPRASATSLLADPLWWFGENMVVMCGVSKCLTDLFAALDKWAEKPAFGTPLEEHLKRSGREIALPIEACVMLLLETGMKEEVRVPGLHVRSPCPLLCPEHDATPALPFFLHNYCWYYIEWCFQILSP